MQCGTLLPQFTIPMRITRLFHSQQYIICQNRTQVLVYSLQKKHTLIKLPKRDQHCLLHKQAPYLFGVFTGQFIQYYSQSLFLQPHTSQLQYLSPKGFFIEDDEQIHFQSAYDARTQSALVLSSPAVIRCKLSKLQPRCLVPFNKGFYAGGYNRSRRPGQHRSPRRTLMYFPDLLCTKKNICSSSIPLQDNQDEPVSLLEVQHPFILAYCKPLLYVLSTDGTLLLKVETLIQTISLLEGRYACNALNAIGINADHRIFTLDVESVPLYGVEIVQYGHAQSLCLEKSGRVLAACSEGVTWFEPGSGKREEVIGMQHIKCMECTLENILIVCSEGTNKRESRINMFQMGV